MFGGNLALSSKKIFLLKTITQSSFTTIFFGSRTIRI